MKRVLYIFIFSMLFMACGSIDIATDYDDEVDFNSYQSYAFYENMNTHLNDLDNQRLIHIIDSTLGQKEFKTSDTPDFKVNFYGEFYQEQSQNNLSIGIGSYGANVGGNVAGGIPLKSKKNKFNLTIEVVDAQKNQLIWQGVGDTKFNPKASVKERMELYKKLVSKILKGFPPTR